MTDKEMALEIAEKFIQLRGRIKALEGAFLELRVEDKDGNRREVPWRDLLSIVESEPSHLEWLRVRRDELRLDTTRPLQALHKGLMG